MTGSGAAVRPARAQDAAGLARVHVAAWRTAYPGVMPQEFLDGLDVEDVTRRWARALETGQAHVLVAEDGGRVVGFASYGPAATGTRADTGTGRGRTEADAGTGAGYPPGGQLYAINLHPDAFGTGAGTALLAGAEAGLAGLGHVAATLWVVPGNARARRFYERQGWVHDGVDRDEQIWGITVAVTRYSRRLGPGAGTPPTSPSPAG